MENKSFKHIDLSTTLRATQISCQLVIPVIKDIYFHIGDKICFCYLKNLKKQKNHSQTTISGLHVSVQCEIKLKFLKLAFK